MLIGLDIGGTKIEAIALDTRDHKEQNRIRIPTPNNYQDFVSAVKIAIMEVSNQQTITSIGIGCCGSLDDAGLMQGANLTFLNGLNFVDEIKTFFNVPTSFSNDANCFALSEFFDGAAKQAKESCIAIIIGTGCGSGIILNSKLLAGARNIAGEIGHNPLPHYDPKKDGNQAKCFCGSVNCNELFVSGTGFKRTFSEKYFEAEPKEIMALYRAGNRDAVNHFDNYCDQLARVIGSVVNVIDPEIIVLGGGLSNIMEIYSKVNQLVDKYTITKETSIKVVKNHHGDSSGVRGAALLHTFI